MRFRLRHHALSLAHGGDQLMIFQRQQSLPLGHTLPFVDLDSAYYKLVPEFERRFPDGAPSLREATSFTVTGDWTFGRKVKVVGEVALETAAADRVPPGSVLEHD